MSQARVLAHVFDECREGQIHRPSGANKLDTSQACPVACYGVFDSYNGMGFWEVFTRYMRSIFRNKMLVFKSSGYREMISEIKAKEEAEKRAAVRKAKEERRRSRKEKG